MYDEVDISPVLKFKEMLNHTAVMTRYIITHPKIQKLLKSDVRFDLVISELALNEALLGNKIFIYKFLCPVTPLAALL